MTAIVDLIDLDRPAASISHGCRHLEWRLDGPGELHRCEYHRAWVEVWEREPMRGEPLAARAWRTGGTSSIRHGFTPRAEQLIHAELVPLVARDFSERWDHAHRTVTTGDDWADRAASERARAAWFERTAELNELYHAGLITTRPIHIEPGMFSRRPQVRCLTTYQRGVTYTDAIGEAFLDGEPTGWLTAKGILPNDEGAR